MGEPGAVIIALMLHKDLGLVLKTAEGAGMDDTVSVAGIAGARGAFGFRIKAPAAVFRPCRIGGMRSGRVDNGPQKTAGWRGVGGVGFGHAGDYIEGGFDTAREPKELIWLPFPSQFPAVPRGGSPRSSRQRRSLAPCAWR